MDKIKKDSFSKRRRWNSLTDSISELSRRDSKKRILVVTTGEQERPIFEGFRVINNIDIIYFLASEFTQMIAENISKEIRKIYDAKILIVNEKELEDIIEKIILIHKENPGSEIIYNLTGGTKMMSLSCYIIASLLGERVFYIFKKDDDSMELIELPTLRFNIEFLNKLSGKKIRLLELIREKPRTLTELSKILKLSKPTISIGYVEKLEQQNLIKKETISRRSQKIGITKTGEIILMLKKSLFKEDG